MDQKSSLVIAAALIPIAAIAVGTLYYINKTTKTVDYSFVSNNPSPTEATSEQSIYQETTTLQQINETANWGIYQNDQHGFEFRYPKGWVINNTAGNTFEMVNSQTGQHYDEKYSLNVVEKQNNSFVLSPNSYTLSYNSDQNDWLLIEDKTGWLLGDKVQRSLEQDFRSVLDLTEGGLRIYILPTGHAGGSPPLYIIPLSSSTVLSLYAWGDYSSSVFDKIIMSFRISK